MIIRALAQPSASVATFIVAIANLRLDLTDVDVCGLRLDGLALDFPRE
jgi:hypothetical protein